MTLPKSIRMAGHTIEVAVDDTIPDFGHYDPDILRIAIRPGPPHVMQQTLRHEMLHAALSLSGIAYIEKLPEEAIVRAMDTIFWPSYDALTTKRKK
jgi:hypothetical protein